MKSMKSINAIYDGGDFTPMEPIPVKGGYEVIITFVKPVKDDKEAREAKCQRLLKHFGTWDEEDVKLMEEMVAERGNRSGNRAVNTEMSHDDYLARLGGLSGAIDDPTFLEPPDIPLEYGAPVAEMV